MGGSSRVVSIDDERTNMNHRRASLFAGGSALFFAALARAETPQPAEPRAEAAPVAAVEPKKEVPSTSRWQTSFYGFLEFDGMYDSTQSFSDSPGNTPIL